MVGGKSAILGYGGLRGGLFRVWFWVVIGVLGGENDLWGKWVWDAKSTKNVLLEPETAESMFFTTFGENGSW